MGMMNEFSAYSWQRLREVRPSIEQREKGGMMFADDEGLHSYKQQY